MAKKKPGRPCNTCGGRHLNALTATACFKKHNLKEDPWEESELILGQSRTVTSKRKRSVKR